MSRLWLVLLCVVARAFVRGYFSVRSTSGSGPHCARQLRSFILSLLGFDHRNTAVVADLFHFLTATQVPASSSSSLMTSHQETTAAAQQRLTTAVHPSQQVFSAGRLPPPPPDPKRSDYRTETRHQTIVGEAFRELTKTIRVEVYMKRDV